MKDIKENFKPYYNKALNETLKLENFIKFEMALMIVKKFAPLAKASKGYIIFTKYQNIGRRNIISNLYILQNASICLKRYRSDKKWNDTLEEYKKEKYAKIRLFEIVDDTISQKDTVTLNYSRREKDYMDYIIYYKTTRSAKYATRGDYKYYNQNNENKVVYVRLNENREEKICDIEHTVKPREKIVLSISDLITSAEKMKEKIPEDHCAETLKKNLIKKVVKGKVQHTDKIEIDKVVNIVGMVGVGKTTLLKVIAYYLNQRGKRIVIVTNSVVEVLSLYQYFKKLGCSCSPLIGKNERVKYINQIIEEDAYYLEEDMSKYLTPNCLIDGLNLEDKNAISFGKEPCTRLQSGKQNYVCSYFDKCNVTLMQRETFSSNIVITTVAGLAITKVGKLQNIFLKEAMETFDVIFYDECDRVQKTLDTLFIPETKFNEFINSSATDCHQFMLDTNRERMKNPDSLFYRELQVKSPIVLACVANAIKVVKEYDKNILDTSFSAFTLLESIKEEISEKTFDKLTHLMKLKIKKVKLNSLYKIMNSSCDSIKTDEFDRLLNEWIDKNEPKLILSDYSIVETQSNKTKKELRQIKEKIRKENNKKKEIRVKIALMITLVYFDKFVIDIEEAYENMQDMAVEYNELISFARSRFTMQQDYLPSALMGNLFGIKTTKEDDVILFRQYAYGRALLTDMPYLSVNKEGEALGPHVILLSGSSFAKGSYEYHINTDVNYIIEAEKSVRDFIASIKFKELGLEERVSGSPLESKATILESVINKCTQVIINKLEKKGKILLVVNSYAQVETIARRLRINLNKENCREEVCEVVAEKDSEDEDNKNNHKNQIRPSEIGQFNKNKARILVAPALIIERGHNIVDEQGRSILNSIFFLIRPMEVPDNIQQKCSKMNGYIANKMYYYKDNDIYKRSIDVRKKATEFWQRMSYSSKRRLDNLNDIDIKNDIVATMFVLILQIFGRLCRVKDNSENPPTIYFVDGAFRKRTGSDEGFDTLNELYLYLVNMLSNEESKEIAKTLYEPFLKAYERGIKHGRTDISNGI